MRYVKTQFKLIATISFLITICFNLVSLSFSHFSDDNAKWYDHQNANSYAKRIERQVSQSTGVPAENLSSETQGKIFSKAWERVEGDIARRTGSNSQSKK